MNKQTQQRLKEKEQRMFRLADEVKKKAKARRKE